MKIGLALSGGGARGVAHAGVLKALEEMDVHCACLSGTSAGSIVAALYAYGYSPDEIFSIVKKVSVFRSVRPAWAWSGLLTMEGLRDLLMEYMPENSFSKLKMPLIIAATDIRRGAIHYFKEGDLIPAILASCTIPVVFNPLPYNGGLYVDGGLLDNLPASVITGQCDFLIGSHCNPISADFDPKNMKVVIERSLLLTINGNTTQSKKICDLVIEPPGLDQFNSFDLAKAQEIFQIGYSYTRYKFSPDNFKIEQP